MAKEAEKKESKNVQSNTRLIKVKFTGTFEDLISLSTTGAGAKKPPLPKKINTNEIYFYISTNLFYF